MHSSHHHLIELCDVDMIRGGRTILSGVNFCVDSGDFVAITGPNGGGKTTLLRLVLGLLKPTSGSVSIASNLTIGYLPQKNTIDSHFPITVREVVESGLLTTHGLSEAERRTRVDQTIELIDLESHRDHPIGEISGGQLQRTLFGRAIISRPNLLVLDEPLSYIDKRFEAHLYNIIADIARYTTILLVSHEMSTISAMANRHFIVDRTVHACSSDHHFVRTSCED